MKKIIFICYLPLTKKIEEDFYLSKLADRGFEVKYLDVADIFFKNLTISDTIERNYVIKINNYKDLEIFLKNNNNAIYPIIITYELRVLRLYRLFKKYNIKTMFFARYGLPIYGNKNIFQKILALIKKPSKIYSILKYFFAKIFVLFGYVKLYDVVFTAGKLIKNNFKKHVNKIVEINYFDYDKYLEIKDKDDKRLKNNKYCVFLDEYLPYHPDLVMFNVPSLEPVSYYKSMNNFFDLIEKIFNIEVVIAAHPKADYTKNIFNGRQIYKYKTAKLVKNSEFCFSHMSSSICFSIFFNKPLFFLYTNEYKIIYKNNYLPFIIKMGNILGRQVFNINDIDDMFDFNNFDMNINCELYSNYIYSYFTTKKSENTQSIDILEKFLKEN